MDPPSGFQEDIPAPNGSTSSAGGTAVVKTRACAKCARLKMKCQWPAGNSTACIRCARMKLACYVPDSQPRKKRSKSTRVAQLENKIDGIVSLLAASQHIQQPSSSHSSSPLTPESVRSTAPSSHGHSSIENPTSGTSTRGAPSSVSSAPSNSHHPVIPTAPIITPEWVSFDLFPGLQLSAYQAAENLDRYRTELQPKYPFVVVPSDMTPSRLYAQSQCLFWAIMASTAPLSPSTQAEFQNWLRKYIAEHVVVQQEKTLEMLQAILVHFAWGDFHFYAEMRSSSLLLLANSLLVDLKLDRAPHEFVITPRTLVADAWQAMGRAGNQAATPHTASEKRALLGVYHISTLLTILNRRAPLINWSPYLGHCCDTLDQTPELETDVEIVALVRLQHTASRVVSLFADVVPGQHTSLRAPTYVAMEGIRKEMQLIMDGLPSTIDPGHTIWSHHQILLMRIYEPLLTLSSPLPSDPPSDYPLRSTGLFQCLDSGTGFFAAQLAIPTPSLHGQPFTFMGLAGFAIVTLSRLLLLEDPSQTDWDASLARKRFDFAAMLKIMADRWEETEKVAQQGREALRTLGDGTAMVTRYHHKVRWIRKWYLSKIPEAERVDAEREDAGPSVELLPMPSLDASTDQQTDFYGMEMQTDDAFWDNFLMSLTVNPMMMPAPYDSSAIMPT